MKVLENAPWDALQARRGLASSSVERDSGGELPSNMLSPKASGLSGYTAPAGTMLLVKLQLRLPSAPTWYRYLHSPHNTWYPGNLPGKSKNLFFFIFSHLLLSSVTLTPNPYTFCVPSCCVRVRVLLVKLTCTRYTVYPRYQGCASIVDM